MLVDESSLVERLGAQAGGTTRIDERIALWQQFCGHHHATATIVNLLDPQARPLDQGAGMTGRMSGARSRSSSR